MSVGVTVPVSVPFTRRVNVHAHILARRARKCTNQVAAGVIRRRQCALRTRIRNDN